MKFAFFGTPDIAVIALEQLKKADLIPSLIVTNPDAAVGRKHTMTAPPVKIWADQNKIATIQPTTLKNKEDLPEITNYDWDLFVVVAYGKLLPKWLLDLPKHQTINLHPSLLPELRGASPIRSAILNNNFPTGVTVMLLDEELDHGPILAQEVADIDESNWPVSGLRLDNLLATTGGELLAETIAAWLNGDIEPQEQPHQAATFCPKITKAMSEVDIDPANLPTGNDAYKIYLKICAFAGWPETFFIHNGKRIKIKAADYNKSTKRLTITRIVPEGKKEMAWSDYF